MSAAQKYTTAELAAIVGKSDRALQVRSNKESWKHSTRPGRGGGKLFSRDDLPEDIRLAISLYEAKQQAGPVASYHDPSQDIPEKARQIGIAKHTIYTAWLAYRKNKKKKKAADAAWLVAYNSGKSHPAEFELIGKVTKQALYRWGRQLKEAEGCFTALCDYRGWAQSYDPLGSIGPEAEAIFKDLYLVPERPSVALAHRSMCAILEQKSLPLPSLRSTYRFIRRYEKDHKDEVTLMRDGEKALADFVGPYITRDDSQLEVGDVLVADGHVLNFTSLHPFTGRPVRQMLIVWFDWASRMPVGWELMPAENTIAIASALQMAIKNLGKYPKVAYLDNGRAFRAKYFTDTSQSKFDGEMKGLFGRLNIAVQFAKPYRGRSKVVERFFGTMSEQCARLLPSYSGRSIADKPAHLLRNEKFHAARHDDYVPTTEQALDIWREYVGWYAQQPHRGLNGRKPIEVLAAGKGPGVDLARLDNAMMWRRTVRPRKCRFRLAGIDYESDALYGLDQEITIYYAWNDLSEIKMYATSDRRYLGVARPVEALHPMAGVLGNDLDMIKVKEANKRQASLKKRTMQLVKDAGASGESVKVLPWMRRQERAPLTVVKGKPAPKPENVKATPQQVKAIEAAKAAYLEAKARPSYDRPKFRQPYDRYSYLFNVKVFDGLPLTAADAEFMAAYEAGPEYEMHKNKFGKLLNLARIQKGETE